MWPWSVACTVCLLVLVVVVLPYVAAAATAATTFACPSKASNLYRIDQPGATYTLENCDIRTSATVQFLFAHALDRAVLPFAPAPAADADVATLLIRNVRVVPPDDGSSTVMPSVQIFFETPAGTMLLAAAKIIVEDCHIETPGGFVLAFRHNGVRDLADVSVAVRRSALRSRSVVLSPTQPLRSARNVAIDITDSTVAVTEPTGSVCLAVNALAGYVHNVSIALARSNVSTVCPDVVTAAAVTVDSGATKGTAVTELAGFPAGGPLIERLRIVVADRSNVTVTATKNCNGVGGIQYTLADAREPYTVRHVLVEVTGGSHTHAHSSLTAGGTPMASAAGVVIFLSAAAATGTLSIDGYRVIITDGSSLRATGKQLVAAGGIILRIDSSPAHRFSFRSTVCVATGSSVVEAVIGSVVSPALAVACGIAVYGYPAVDEDFVIAASAFVATGAGTRVLTDTTASVGAITAAAALGVAIFSSGHARQAWRIADSTLVCTSGCVARVAVAQTLPALAVSAVGVAAKKGGVSSDVNRIAITGLQVLVAFGSTAEVDAPQFLDGSIVAGGVMTDSFGAVVHNSSEYFLCDTATIAASRGAAGSFNIPPSGRTTTGGDFAGLRVVVSGVTFGANSACLRGPPTIPAGALEAYPMSYIASSDLRLCTSVGWSNADATQFIKTGAKLGISGTQLGSAYTLATSFVTFSPLADAAVAEAACQAERGPAWVAAIIGNLTAAARTAAVAPVVRPYVPFAALSTSLQAAAVSQNGVSASGSSSFSIVANGVTITPMGAAPEVVELPGTRPANPRFVAACADGRGTVWFVPFFSDARVTSVDTATGAAKLDHKWPLAFRPAASGSFSTCVSDPARGAVWLIPGMVATMMHIDTAKGTIHTHASVTAVLPNANTAGGNNHGKGWFAAAAIVGESLWLIPVVDGVGVFRVSLPSPETADATKLVKSPWFAESRGDTKLTSNGFSAVVDVGDDQLWLVPTSAHDPLLRLNVSAAAVASTTSTLVSASVTVASQLPAPLDPSAGFSTACFDGTRIWLSPAMTVAGRMVIFDAQTFAAASGPEVILGTHHLEPVSSPSQAQRPHVGCIFDSESMWLIPHGATGPRLLRINPADTSRVVEVIDRFPPSVIPGSSTKAFHSAAFNGSAIWFAPFNAVGGSFWFMRARRSMASTTDGFGSTTFAQPPPLLQPKPIHNPVATSYTGWPDGVTPATFGSDNRWAAVTAVGEHLWLVPYSATSPVVIVHRRTGTMEALAGLPAAARAGSERFSAIAYDGNRTVWLFPLRLGSVILVDALNRSVRVLRHSFPKTTVTSYGPYNGGLLDGKYAWLIPLGVSTVQRISMADPDATPVEFGEWGAVSFRNGAFSGAAYDGRDHVWFAPWHVATHILRLHRDSMVLSSIAVPTLTDGTAMGPTPFGSLAFDGAAIYFSPQLCSRGLRVDVVSLRILEIGGAGSWPTADARTGAPVVIDVADPKLHSGGFDGRYAWFVQRQLSPKLVRYDAVTGAMSAFDDVTGWNHSVAAADVADLRFVRTAFDGERMWITPVSPNMPLIAIGDGTSDAPPEPTPAPSPARQPATPTAERSATATVRLDERLTTITAARTATRDVEAPPASPPPPPPLRTATRSATREGAATATAALGPPPQDIGGQTLTLSAVAGAAAMAAQEAARRSADPLAGSPAQAAVSATATAAVVAASVTVLAPSSASQPARLLGAASQARCGRGLEAPSHLEHPFQFPLVSAASSDDGGDGDEGEAAAIAATASGTVWSSALVAVLVGPGAWLALRPAAPPPASDSSASPSSSAPAPGWAKHAGMAMAVAPAYLLPSVAGGAAALGYRGAHVWTVVLGAVVTAGSCAAALAVMRRGMTAASDASTSKQSQAEEQPSPVAASAALVAVAEPTVAGLRADAGAAGRWYYAVELLAGVAFGAASGLQPPTSAPLGVCRATGVAGVLVAAGYCAYTAVVRPLADGLEAGFAVVVAVLQVGLAVLAAGASWGGVPEAGEEESASSERLFEYFEWLALATTVAFFVQAAAVAVKAVVTKQRAPPSARPDIINKGGEPLDSPLLHVPAAAADPPSSVAVLSAGATATTPQATAASPPPHKRNPLAAAGRDGNL